VAETHPGTTRRNTTRDYFTMGYDKAKSVAVAELTMGHPKFKKKRFHEDEIRKQMRLERRARRKKTEHAEHGTCWQSRAGARLVRARL